MPHRCSLLLTALLPVLAAACADPAPGPGGYPLTPTGADDDATGGDGDQPTGDAVDPNGDTGLPPAFVPPSGPYLLVSPVVTDPALESDRLTASGAFAADVRIGHVTDLRALAVGVRWDPAVLALASHAPSTTWLASAGGVVLTGLDRLDVGAGTLAVALAAGGATTAVSTSTSAAIVHLELAWTGTPTTTVVRLELPSSWAGVLPDGASAPLDGVTTVDLTVTPGP